MSTAKRARVEISLDQKREIIHYNNNNPGLTQQQLCDFYFDKWKVRIGRSTMCEILKNECKYLSLENLRSPGAIRLTNGHYKYLDEALHLWFKGVRAQNIVVSDKMLQEQARRFGEMFGIGREMNYSIGYISNWKNRFNIKMYKISGESKSVDQQVVNRGREELLKLTSNYDINDIYNFDETALFYRLMPNKTLATVSSSDNKTSGIKESKERLSIGISVNATATDKCKPVVIAKYARPRCFPKSFDPNYVVQYYNNTKAWMTGNIFNDWIKRFNTRMKINKRKVLLLIDNACSHIVNDDTTLTNVTIQFLPPNTTSVLQPLDAGIIRSFKCKYKCILVNQFLTSIEEGNGISMPNVKDALYMIEQAWNQVNEETITNCFSHCSIIQALKSGIVPKIDFTDLQANINRLKLEKPLNSEEFLDIESHIQTGEVLTEEDIVSLVKEPEVVEEVEVEEVEELKEITCKDAKNYINNLLLYMEQHQEVFELNDCKYLMKIRDKIASFVFNSCKQTDLRSHFKRKLFNDDE